MMSDNNIADNDLTPSVLIVEDERLLGQVYQSYLESAGYNPKHVVSGNEALQCLQINPPDILLLDLMLPDMGGLEILQRIQLESLPITVIIITSESSANIAVEAMHAGAFDYLVKPVDAERLLTTVRNASERQKLRTTLTQFQSFQQRDHFEGFLGQAPLMQAVYRMIESASASNASVFITGESGTGKELCAEAIHNLSGRQNNPIIAINCAAIPRELLESEIFGHTKGAFSGATKERSGAAGAANKGTLFFDEVCDMDMDLQAKLLRFIQTKRYRRVGSDKEEETDVRFICATNRNPLTEVRSGRFREDLYYRLFVIPIELPPLRLRGSDVLQLAAHFLEKYAEEESKHFDGFLPEAEQALLDFNWPGNVRQLQNLFHKMVVVHNGGVVSTAMLDLPDYDDELDNLTDGENATTYKASGENVSNSRLNKKDIRPLWEEEKNTIERAIELCDGNVVEAASKLGISDSTIYRKRSKWLKQ